ncbi:MAG: zinc-binding dehydrogenase [Ignavibacteria bacterium]
MKAAVLIQTGDSGQLEKNLVVKDIPVPEISADEVLVNIKSASLNHRDLWIAKGMYSKIDLPVVLGSDGAGIIHNKGVNVKGLEAGDEVMINPGMNWGNDENFQSKDFRILGMPDNGTLTQFIKVHHRYVHKKPAHLNFEQASAIPLAGVTAYRALFKKAGINKSDNILITGIGGGVASMALTFALKTGAKVFVTSGDDTKIAKAISLGAAGGVNYKKIDWDKQLIELSGNKINVIIDGSGGASYTNYLDLISYGGRIVCYGATLGSVPQFNLHRLYWKQIKLMGSTMGSSKDFEEMIKFIDEKKVVPVIDEVFPIQNVSEAFKKMDEGKQFGKIVVGM